MTLKNKILCFFGIIAFLPNIALSIYFYSTENAKLQQTAESYQLSDLQNLNAHLSNRIFEIEEMVNWICRQRRIQHFMSNYRNEVYSNQSERLSEYDILFKDFISNSTIGQYIDLIVVQGYSGYSLRYGFGAHLLRNEAIVESEIFTTSLMDPPEKINWKNLGKSPSPLNPQASGVPFVYPVTNEISGEKIGWIFIFVNVEALSEVLSSYQPAEGEQQLLLLNTDLNICIYDSFHEMDFNTYPFPLPDNQITKSGKHVLSDEKIAYYIKTELPDTLLLKIIPSTVQANREIISVTGILFTGSMFICIFFAWILSIYLTKPLTKLNLAAKKITQGDFSENLQIEGPDEIGLLGKNINMMALSIREMLTRAKEDEEKKHQLQLQVLQHQINPHFLFNTLNSIKWLAVIQRADNIVASLDALGQIMKNILFDLTEFTAIKDEFYMLDNYILLLRYRYSNALKIEYVIDEERLLEEKIPRMILQPILENSVFHGLSSAEFNDNMILRITLKEQNGDLCITVFDNGAGMSEDVVQQILNGIGSEEVHRGISGLGLKNVKERLGVIYGENFRFDVESELGRYTSITLYLPVEKIKFPDDNLSLPEKREGNMNV